MKSKPAKVVVPLAAAIFIGGALLTLSPRCREHLYLTWSYWRSSTAIDFYGRVVDQGGNPIHGADVVIVINKVNPGTLSGSKEYLIERRHTLKTDANGSFALRGASGTYLRVEQVTAGGYARFPEPELRGGAHTAQGYGYSRDRGVPYYVPDRQKPAIFPLRKEGEPRVLWPSRGGEDTKNPWDSEPR